MLTGKVAAVSGGGRGIGRGITERLLAAGTSVAILQRSELDESLASRDDVLHVPVDMADADAFAAAFDRIADIFGGVDVLVSNAGMMAEQSLADLTVGQWDLMMAVNARAPVFLAQAALPHMRRRGGGSIINVGSVEGLAANPLHIAYSASKGAVHGLTRAMAVDLGTDGIRCNSIAPGWIVSELSERYLNEWDDPAAARSRLLDLHPVGRLGQAGDIGDAVVFLASDSASFMTGQTVVVDGGRMAKLSSP